MVVALEKCTDFKRNVKNREVERQQGSQVGKFIKSGDISLLSRLILKYS